MCVDAVYIIEERKLPLKKWEFFSALVFKGFRGHPMFALMLCNSNETVRKIRKNSVENTARNLSICDNLAAGVFFRILAGKKTIFKRKRHVSGQNHLH